VWAVRLVCLALILSAHFATRWKVARAALEQPALWGTGALYPDVYRVSFALAEGKGYRTIALGGVPLTEQSILEKQAATPDAKLPDEARSLVEFFRFERQKVSRRELTAYWASSAAECPEAGNYESGRVFDLYAVALLWRVFGVSWPVFYAFSAAVSTLCCLAIFLIAWRLSNSWIAGLAAAALFAFSPFESHCTIRTLRDISPLWSAAFSFAVFVLFVERFQSNWANALAAFALGAVAYAGKGWRADAILLAPILLAALVATAWRARGFIAALLAGGAYLLGAASVMLILSLIAPAPKGSTSTDFHVAYYGYSARANILGIENSLQITRCDLDTYFRACERHQAADLPGPPPRIYGPGYGQLCRSMFFEALPYHSHVYARSFPWFYWQALAAFPAEGQLQGEDIALARCAQSRKFWPLHDWCLGPLTTILPFLFVLGAITLFLGGHESSRGGWLLVFSVYYALVLLAVLPERKHCGQLLLPLYVFAGLGVLGLFRLLRAASVFELPKPDASGLRWAFGFTIAAFALWLVGCVVTYPISLAARQKMLADIRERAAEGEDASDHVAGPRWFSAVRTDQPTGYLLTVDSLPGDLLVCRIARPEADGVPGRDYVSRHRLSGNRQAFCVCLPSDADGDPRPLACSVHLPKCARILSCVRFRPARGRLAGLSTLFSPDDDNPGPPLLGTSLAADLIAGCAPCDIRYQAEPDAFTRTGLPLEGALALTPAPGKEIRPAHLRGEGADITPAPNGVKVTARPGEAGKALGPSFEAPCAGMYLFEVRYRPGTSAAVAVLEGKGRSQRWTGPRDGRTHTLYVLARLRRGETARLALWPVSNLPSRSASFTVESARVSALPPQMSRLARKEQ
jgi:hypothetical protein